MAEPLDQKALEMARRSVGLMAKAARMVQLLRYYDSRQILRRGFNVLGRKLNPGKHIGQIQSAGGRLQVSEHVTALASRIVEMQSDHPSHTQCDIASGKYVMLNDSISLPSGFDSSLLNQKSHLWRFQFHYHEFLLTQAANGNWNDVSSFLDAWIKQYSPEKVKCSDDAWHPYCISRRLVAWVWLLNVAQNDESCLDALIVQRMLDSSIQQANYLLKNLERDLGGNHLLENVTALAIASGAIDSTDAKQWSRLAARVLAVELEKQILPHGEHFELSPMYHCQILSNLLRMEICCRDDKPLLSVVSPKIDPMLNFLGSIGHPDGEIPLFADSGFHEAPSVREISAVAELTGRSLSSKKRSQPLESIGGYRIFRGQQLFAVCDFGPIAAPTLPAHGHCDVTNLEVSVEGERWIVDSGNFNYADDSMRHYCRSSIGHNVVTVNDENQANVWSKFRMGDRARISDCQSGVRDQFHWATVAHDGYRRLGVSKISRLVAFRDQTAICFDRAKSSDQSAGSLVGYLHLHPDVSATRESDTTKGLVCFRLMRGSTERKISFVADEVSTEQGWYCAGFGQRVAGTVVRYVRPSDAQVLGWILHELSDEPLIKCSSDSIQITMGSLDVSWTEFPE